MNRNLIQFTRNTEIKRLISDKQYTYFNWGNTLYFTDLENIYENKIKTLNAFKREFKKDLEKDIENSNISESDKKEMIKKSLATVKNRIYTSTLTLNLDALEKGTFKYIKVDTSKKEKTYFNILINMPKESYIKEVEGKRYKSNLENFKNLSLFIHKEENTYYIREYFTGACLVFANTLKAAKEKLETTHNNMSKEKIEKYIKNNFEKCLIINNGLSNGNNCNYNFLKH